MKARNWMHSLKTILVLACATLVAQAALAADPLPSWNDGDTKTTIVEFVQRVSQEGSPDFVPESERIATFDNDGTLWTEKPTYTHILSLLDRIKEQLAADLSLAERQPYKSIVDKDKDYFLQLYENQELEPMLDQLLALPFAGFTQEEYQAWNRKWIDNWKHPHFGVGVSQLIYQPMVELVDYLEANGFTVFIVTADEASFLRIVSEELYGLPPHQVHGTHTATAYVAEGSDATLYRTLRVDYLDNWAGKPRLIEQAIGVQPIFAAGNSNGDQHMLQWTARKPGPSMSLIVHHTDAEREFAYDGHTDKVIPSAKDEGYLVVDMKNDWNQVFPGK